MRAHRQGVNSRACDKTILATRFLHVARPASLGTCFSAANQEPGHVMNLDVFSNLFSVIAPVFFIAAIGYGWGKSGKTFDTPMVTMLVINIGVPCLIIDVLLNADLTAQAMSEMALAAFVALAATAIVSAPWC